MLTLGGSNLITDGMKKRSVKVGVIAAAGKGTRAYPRTSFIPKPLFKIENTTILERNVDIQFNQFGVDRLYIIVGHLKEMVLDEIERIKKKFPQYDIIPALWTGKGLAADIASLRDQIQEDFAVILGDELYFNTDHKKLVSFWKKKKNGQALIATLQSGLISDIRKNYSVEINKDRVLNLIEKPQDPPNRTLGLGTYIFSADYFIAFDATPPSDRSGVVELTDVIDRMAKETKEVYSLNLSGSYFNINSLADLYSATYRIRSEKFNTYKISLVLPSYNNEMTIPDVLSDFKGHVDEIIVADMNSNDRTVSIAESNKVKIISYKNNFADFIVHSAVNIRDAIARAKGDIVVLGSADGSFRARDLPKLLEYLKDSDMVVGTRTTRQLIEQGSNLISRNRWINVILGKVLEIMWWSQEPRFTDVGCIYRAFWKESFERINVDLRAKDKTYLPEMMIEIVRYHMRCIEIPVSYFKTYGAIVEESGADLRKYFFSILRMFFSRRFGKS